MRLPAIAEEDETHVIKTPYGSSIVRRNTGEALHPEREPLELLQQLRRTIGEYNFAGQYQQEPAPLGGGMVKEEWFRRYVPGQEPSKFEVIVQSWDTANKSTELSDYSVCITLGRKKKSIYLLDVQRQKLDYPHLKRAVQQQAARFKPNNILIEDKASGTQLIQDLINDGVYGVTRYEPQMDKIMRLHSVTNTIENGFVYLPTEAPWLAAYLQELTTFPNGKHDDQADATSQALDWIKANTHSYAVFEYFRREAIRNGWAIDPSLLDQFDDLQNIPPKCPDCESAGPGHYGRRYHCNQCGREWKDIRYCGTEPSIPRCTLPTGEILVLDEGRRLWVDTITGDTYPPGDE